MANNSTPVNMNSSRRRPLELAPAGEGPSIFQQARESGRLNQNPKPQSKSGGNKLSIENANNHGALEDGAFARSQPGYTGRNGRWATFATPEDGARAQVNLLRKNYRNMSVAEVVQKYAPLSGENPEAAVRNYIGYVSSRIGVDPDAKLTDDKYEQLGAAMRAFETGKKGQVRFSAYGGQLRGAGARGSSGSSAGNGAAGALAMPASQAVGPSGRMNTGVTQQNDRINSAGPLIERQQQALVERAGNAGAFLDSMLDQMQSTQQAQMQAMEVQVGTARNINEQMTQATKTLQEKAAPVFQRRGEILDQALEIQSMSPIARAVRGFFDLNYNEKFLLSQSEKLGQILKQAGDSYTMSQALAGDALEQNDQLYKINTAIPGLQLQHAEANARGAELQLAQAKSELDITLGGVQNELGLMAAKTATRNDMLSRLDSPTMAKLLVQAEANNGVVNFQGVELSSQELREGVYRGEQLEYSAEMAQMALANGRADLADKEANRMIEYMSEAELNDAIANGGVFRGIQLPPGVLTSELTNRATNQVKQAEIRSMGSTPDAVGGQLQAAGVFAQQVQQQTDNMFGGGAMADEVIQYSNQVKQLAQQYSAAVANGASPLELGILQQEIQAARTNFGKQVQEKLTRLVGGDKQTAAIAGSYLMGDRLTPGAAADAAVHLASGGGMPAALGNSQFGVNAMTQVGNVIAQLRATKNPATGKVYTEEAAKREAARRIADPTSAEGRQFREATGGMNFQSNFMRLPHLARNGANAPTHPFGKLNASTWRTAVSTADAMGIAEIANTVGLSAGQLTSVLGGKNPGLDEEKFKELRGKAPQLGAQVSAAQQRRLADVLDQSDPVVPNMKNSQLLSDFLQSPEGQAAFQRADTSDGRGIADWLATTISSGGTQSRMTQYQQGYTGALNVAEGERRTQSLRLAEGYRNDPMRRTGAILRGMGFKPQEITQLAGAMQPLIPQGTARQQEGMEIGKLSDRIHNAPGSMNLFGIPTYRTDLAARQINSIDQIITNHKFDDPQVEALRKRAAKGWQAQSESADHFIDGLLGR